MCVHWCGKPPTQPTRTVTVSIWAIADVAQTASQRLQRPRRVKWPSGRFQVTAVIWMAAFRNRRVARVGRVRKYLTPRPTTANAACLQFQSMLRPAAGSHAARQTKFLSNSSFNGQPESAYAARTRGAASCFRRPSESTAERCQPASRQWPDRVPSCNYRARWPQCCGRPRKTAKFRIPSVSNRPPALSDLADRRVDRRH